MVGASAAPESATFLSFFPPFTAAMLLLTNTAGKSTNGAENFVNEAPCGQVSIGPSLTSATVPKLSTPDGISTPKYRKRLRWIYGSRSTAKNRSDLVTTRKQFAVV